MATTVKPGEGGTFVIETTPDASAAPAAHEPTPTERKLFTEDELEAARRQEKDKLYPKLTKLEEKLAQFEQERQAAIDAAQAAAQRAEDERKKREEEELGLRDLIVKKEDELKAQFNTVQQEWEQKLTALQQQNEAQQALLERERQYQALTAYKNRRIQEDQDELMPELLDFITGNTEEEIESSISTIKERTAAIVGGIQQSLGQQPQRVRGVSPTGATPSGPLENVTEQQTLTSADIANMSMEQYAQIRGRLMEAASATRRR